MADLFSYADTDGRPALIYVAVNRLNGYRYIGMTREPLRRRISNHVGQARYSKRTKSRFLSALLEFGRENFDFYVLETCASVAVAKQREVDFIERMNPEYNVTKGGNGKWREPREFSLASREALTKLNERNRKSPPMLGRLHSQEAIAKMRSKPKTKYWLGKNRDAETRKKISDARRKNGPSVLQVRHTETLRSPVICVLDGLAFPSLTAAALHYGCAVNTVLRNCARHSKSNGKNVGRFVYADAWWNEEVV